MKAVILFSGGLDSTVVLALALEKKRDCYALSFDYGQKHRIELESAKRITQHYAVPHQITPISSPHFSHSSLVSNHSPPKNRSQEAIEKEGVPSTYVPARNTLFLAYALGQAEFIEAEEIYFGPNILDYHPYPDCRPEFIEAFQGVMNVATKQATHSPPRLITPLIHWNKEEIITEGRRLNAPLHLSFSCYSPTSEGDPCDCCDACLLRSRAFSRLEAKEL